VKVVVVVREYPGYVATSLSADPQLTRPRLVALPGHVLLSRSLHPPRSSNRRQTYGFKASFTSAHICQRTQRAESAARWESEDVCSGPTERCDSLTG
jgi:hypothetical protein